MLQKIMISVATFAIERAPLERIVAWGLNRAISAYVKNPDDTRKYDRVVQIVERVSEQVRIASNALRDRYVTRDEVTQSGLRVLAAWAKGRFASRYEERTAMRENEAQD